MKHTKVKQIFLLLLLSSLFLPAAADAQNAENSTLSVFVIGDWGTGGRGARRVGEAMSAGHAAEAVQAVISTGDNIYPSGVSSVDDPQWDSKFERIFPAESLPVPFWAVLGNHDYREDPDAQVDYTGHRLDDGSITRWQMPGRYWSTVLRSPDESIELRVVGIDTQLLVGNAGTRKSHLAWLDSVLAASGEEHIFVVGHHPVYSHGHYGNNRTLVRHLAPLLVEHGVRAYLNGHEHDLQLIKPIDGVRYIISGGGGGKRKSKAGKNTEFSASSLGFVRIDLREDRMHLACIDSRGKLLYETTDTLQTGP